MTLVISARVSSIFFFVLEDKAKSAAYFKLIGYVFFLQATWFICGHFGAQFSEGLAQFTPRSPIDVIICLVLGWLFSFIGHYKGAKASSE